MKLSFANFPLDYIPNFPLNDESVLKTIRECGFTCTDYNITMDHLQDNFEERALSLKKTLENLDMSAPQAHAPIINPFDPGETDYNQMFERSLRFCELAGIPMVVIHAGAVKDNTREEYFEKNVAFYRSLIPAAERTGVEVLIENIGHPADANYLYVGADLREMADRVDHPLFNICWDTGHGNLNKQNLYESVITMGDKLHALHVHDNVGYFEPSYRHHRIDMHTMPYATQYASVNYDALIQGLIDIGYKGTFNFEVLTVSRSIRPAFTYNGEIVRKLEFPSIELWKKANTLLYDIGKYMLEAYGLYEV
jgi:sugar phosphate isomerase/epimerase